MPCSWGSSAAPTRSWSSAKKLHSIRTSSVKVVSSGVGLRSAAPTRSWSSAKKLHSIRTSSVKVVSSGVGLRREGRPPPLGERTESGGGPLPLLSLVSPGRGRSTRRNSAMAGDGIFDGNCGSAAAEGTVSGKPSTIIEGCVGLVNPVVCVGVCDPWVEHPQAPQSIWRACLGGVAPIYSLCRSPN